MAPKRSLYQKVRSRYQRTASERLARRPFAMASDRAMISFTFDDFPQSALQVAGAILQQNGIAGTYYASFGLMGQLAPTGMIFEEDDIAPLLQAGHELGCHTFAHCPAAETSPVLFEQSILENARTLQALAPGVKFKTHSYPIGSPKPATKRRCAKYFENCRGGGQIYNSGTIDLNRLDAFFLEQARDRPETINEMIEANQAKRGWLIFATHDVCDRPTRFGCTPELFEQVVAWSKKSGADLLSVSDAFGRLKA